MTLSILRIVPLVVLWTVAAQAGTPGPATTPAPGTDRAAYCTDLDRAIARLTQEATTHRDAMIAAARQARADRVALDEALSQYTTVATLLDASSAMDLGLNISPLGDNGLNIGAIEDIIEALRLAFDHLMTDMRAVARADAQLEATLDQLEPLTDALSVFCGAEAPPVAAAEPPVDDAPPGMIQTALGIPIPASLSWTDGWVLDIPGELVLPWLDDPDQRRMSSAVRVTVGDGGNVIHATLAVPFGRTQ